MNLLTELKQMKANGKAVVSLDYILSRLEDDYRRSSGSPIDLLERADGQRRASSREVIT
jgi:hypothetical protein